MLSQLISFSLTAPSRQYAISVISKLKENVFSCLHVMVRTSSTYCVEPKTGEANQSTEEGEGRVTRGVETSS